jgi:hypothetical protein
MRPNPCRYARRRVRELAGDLPLPRRRRRRLGPGRGQRRVRTSDRRPRGDGVRLARCRSDRLLARPCRSAWARRRGGRLPRTSLALAQRGHGRDRRPLDHVYGAAYRHVRHHRPPHRRSARDGGAHRRARPLRPRAHPAERRARRRFGPPRRRRPARPEALARVLAGELEDGLEGVPAGDLAAVRPVEARAEGRA